MSIRLYVGNLPKEIERQELEAVFAEFDNTISTKVITDRRTGKCRGFGFVTVKNDEQADQVIEKFNGYMFKDSPLKIEKALPRAKGKAGEELDQPAAGGSAPAAAVGSSANRRNNKNSKSRKPAATMSDSDSVQPDPRWAQELEKLKQLLATQTANS